MDTLQSGRTIERPTPEHNSEPELADVEHKEYRDLIPARAQRRGKTGRLRDLDDPRTTLRVPRRDDGEQVGKAVAQPPVRLKLVPPVEYDGKTYTEIIADFDNLIGNDYIRCDREFRHVYKPGKDEIPFAEMNPVYHVILIAHAADVPQGLIKKLPGRYYNLLKQEALKAVGSSAEEKE